MKKFLAICMAWILCMGLAGCGRGETAPAESAVPPVQPQQTVPDNPLVRQVIYEDKGIRITVKGMEEDTMTGTEIRILDTDTFETIALVPLELTTTHAGDGSFSYDESGVELFQSDGITVIAQVVQEEFYGKTARLLVKNGTGKDIIVEAEHVSVNGFTLDAWLYDTVAADTVRYCHLDLFETGLAENGIDSIESISFQLSFLDAHTYEPIARSEQLTVDVKG